MEASSTNLCVCGFFLFGFFFCCFLVWVFWGEFGGFWFGWFVLGFFWYIFNLFSVESIFLEFLKVYRPQIAFYTCQHKEAKSSAFACLSDMMPMLLESGFSCHPRIFIYCDKQKLYSLTKIPASFSVP